MKTNLIKIKKLLIVLFFILAKMLTFTPPAIASVSGTEVTIPQGFVIPVRFKYSVDGSDLQAGDAIPLEVIEDIYIESNLIFRSKDVGYAFVTRAESGKILGIGGKIEISAGEITDIYGNKHSIVLSEQLKGDSMIGPLVLTLLSSGVALAIAPDILFDSVESTLIGAGLSLAPFHFGLKKGNEANVSNGKVIFAHHVSPASIYIR